MRYEPYIVGTDGNRIALGDEAECGGRVGVVTRIAYRMVDGTCVASANMRGIRGMVPESALRSHERSESERVVAGLIGRVGGDVNCETIAAMTAELRDLGLDLTGSGQAPHESTDMIG